MADGRGWPQEAHWTTSGTRDTAQTHLNLGAGMSYVRGQVITEDGRLIASFTQDAMIRALEPHSPAAALPAAARL
jgi:hypothetical protein